MKREHARHSTTGTRGVAKAKVRALAARVQCAREEERIRVAREIHDQLGQSLTAIRMDVASLVRDMRQERETAIFRILQESLTNIARHANANHVDIRLSQDHSDVVLEVRDNGRGIGEEQVTIGNFLGFLGMRERAHLLRGKFTITSCAGGGTRVRVRIPETGK